MVNNHGLFFLILIFFCFAGYSQEAQIKHYQRNCTFSSLLLPCSSYNSNLFSISFPDSLYSSGDITIKKLKVSNYKVRAKFYFSKEKYYKVIYLIKKKNLPEFKKKLNQTQFEITEEQLNRKIKVTLICKSI